MKIGADELIEYWAALPRTEARFLHAADRDWLSATGHLDKFLRPVPLFPDDWVVEAMTSNVQLGLLPVPFLGDLRKAEIIICLLNPGLEPGDFYAEQHVDEFRSALSRSLAQDFTADERYPFLFLDPKWCWTGGYRWWTKKLSGVILELAKRRGTTFHEAASLAARKIAAVEFRCL